MEDLEKVSKDDKLEEEEKVAKALEQNELGTDATKKAEENEEEPGDLQMASEVTAKTEGVAPDELLKDATGPT